MASNIPGDCRYTKEHEWVKVTGGNRARVGITEYAQSELGDVVFVELPEVGQSLTKGTSFGTVESVKAVSDVYAPVSGEVSGINEKLQSSPELINQSPYEDGWILEAELEDPSQVESLLSPADYEKLLGETAK